MSIDMAVAVMVLCAVTAGCFATIATLAAVSVFRQIAAERASRAAGTATQTPATAGKSRSAVERHQLTDRLQR